MEKFKFMGKIGMERANIFGVGVEYVTSLYKKKNYVTDSLSIVENKSIMTFQQIVKDYIEPSGMTTDYYIIKYAFKDSDIKWSQEFINENIKTVEVEYINIEYLLEGLSIAEILTLDDEEYNLKDIFIKQMGNDFLLSIEPVV